MKAEMLWLASQHFFLLSVASHTIITYAWNSEALYFSSQCKVNANMENVMANFKDGHRPLKEPESIQRDIWVDQGTKMLEHLLPPVFTGWDYLPFKHVLSRNNLKFLVGSQNPFQKMGLKPAQQLIWFMAKSNIICWQFPCRAETEKCLLFQWEFSFTV